MKQLSGILLMFLMITACSQSDEEDIQRQDEYKRKDASPVHLIPLPGKKTDMNDD